MDNRVNQIRSKISVLRLEMGKVEGAMRAAIAKDRDCSEAALQLMSLRREVAELARQRGRLGDNSPIGTMDLRKPRFAKA